MELTDGRPVTVLTTNRRSKEGDTVVVMYRAKYNPYDTVTDCNPSGRVANGATIQNVPPKMVKRVRWAILFNNNILYEYSYIEKIKAVTQAMSMTKATNARVVKLEWEEEEAPF